MSLAYALNNGLNLQNVNLFTGTGTITMVNEGAVVVNKTVGAATAVTLPANPASGYGITFKFIMDGKGDAASNNITITPASGNINGAANYVISENYGAVLLAYPNGGTEWKVAAAYKNNATIAAQTITALTVGSGGLTSLGRMTTTDGVASGTARVVGGLAYSNVAASTAVASTSAETLFDTFYTMPANTLKAGTVVRVKFWGTGTTVVGTDTLAYKLYIGGIGGTALISSAATTMINGHTFLGECMIQCRTAGASGTLVAAGFYKKNSAEGTMTVLDDVTASTTINTQASQVIGVSAQFNTANANSVRLDMLTVEIY